MSVAANPIQGRPENGDIHHDLRVRSAPLRRVHHERLQISKQGPSPRDARADLRGEELRAGEERSGLGDRLVSGLHRDERRAPKRRARPGPLGVNRARPVVRGARLRHLRAAGVDREREPSGGEAWSLPERDFDAREQLSCAAEAALLAEAHAPRTIADPAPAGNDQLVGRAVRRRRAGRRTKKAAPPAETPPA